MNENIDLTEILKDCPEGTKLYSPLFGYVELKEIDTSKVYSVNVKLTSGLIESFTREGKLYDRDYYKDTECVLFPSKEQRDWSKFTAHWLKKESDIIALLEKQDEQKEEVHFPKFTFDDVLALHCCMETVKEVQKDKELYNKLNLTRNKIYDAYWFGKQDEQEEPQVYEAEDGEIITYSETDGYKDEQKHADKNEPRFKFGNWITIKQ